MRKYLVIAAVLALFVGISIPLYRMRAESIRFGQDFVGMKESDVIAKLGPPCFDARANRNYSKGKSYTLGWYYNIDSQLGLVFEDGKVVKQWYGSK